MNRSYSKIRHIQESNQRLEKRLLGEQLTNKEQQAVDFEKNLNNKEFQKNLVNQSTTNTVTQQPSVQTQSKQPTSQTQQPAQNTKYMVGGTKFCFFGSCRVDVKVVDKTTGQILISKGAEGTDVNQLYPQVIKQVQDDLTSKKIVGVTLPTLEQLQDTSPKK